MIPEISSFQFTIFSIAVISIVIIAILIRIILTKNLIESVILLSLFSMCIGLCYLLMDAPDVTMTETALGVCISTCAFINIIYMVGEHKNYVLTKKHFIISLCLCIILSILLIIVGMELPDFGSADAPLHLGVSDYYINNSKEEIGIDSMIAAILASYRAFDTFGETIVVLIAGISVLLVLSSKDVTKNAEDKS